MIIGVGYEVHVLVQGSWWDFVEVQLGLLKDCWRSINFPFIPSTPFFPVHFPIGSYSKLSWGAIFTFWLTKTSMNVETYELSFVYSFDSFLYFSVRVSPFYLYVCVIRTSVLFLSTKSLEIWINSYISIQKCLPEPGHEPSISYFSCKHSYHYTAQRGWNLSCLDVITLIRWLAAFTAIYVQQAN